MITGIDSVTKDDELILKVGFRLIPSKADFSKKLKSVSITTRKRGLERQKLKLR